MISEIYFSNNQNTTLLFKNTIFWIFEKMKQFDSAPQLKCANYSILEATNLSEIQIIREWVNEGVIFLWLF